MPRTPITSIYIICEGRNTEPIYLERIKEEVEEDNYLAISIYPDKSDKNSKSDPIGLIKEAIENKFNYDEIYVVYDKDGYTKHAEASALLEEHSDKIRLVFSSISFETWILMHFERCSNSFPKSSDIINKKFVHGSSYLSTYEKKGAFDLYPLIKENTKIALINAAWLRHIQASSLGTIPLYDVNPYTDVDFLVKRLFEIREQYCFLSHENHVDIELIHFSFSIDEDKLFLTVVNSRQISFTTNQLEFCKDQDFDISAEVDSIVLAPDEKYTFEFTDFANLSLKFESYYIFFDLP